VIVPLREAMALMSFPSSARVSHDDSRKSEQQNQAAKRDMRGFIQEVM
jgi:hypothetical protein